MASADNSFEDVGAEVCATCSRRERDHPEGGSGHWLKCFLCGERSIDDCARETWLADSGVWSCGQCRNVMVKLRTVVKDWDDKSPKRKSDSSAPESKSKIAELEESVRHWRKKVAERNCELREMQKSVRQLNERTNQLNDAETELRLLRQQIQQYQRQIQQGGMGGMMMGQAQGGYDQSAWMQQQQAAGMNMGGDVNSYKRPGSFEGGPPSKRQMSSESVLWAVDNVLRGLVMNQRLQVEFWRRKWDVILRRGGSTDAIYDATMKTLQKSGGTKYNHIVVCAGAIDLETCTRVDDSSRLRYRNNLVRNIFQIAEEGVKNGATVWVIAPPPRKQCPPWERSACIGDLREALKPLDKTHIIQLEESMSDDMFINMKLYDGIHIKQDWEVPAVELVLAYMGLDGRIPFDDSFAKEEMFGYDACWRCAGQHKRAVTPCRDFTPCERCSDPKHHSDVCLFSCKMCMTCGERGHGPDRCKLRTERY